jgi:hypothetical protein
MSVDTTTFLSDLKIVYGTIQDQISREPMFMNLLGDGSKLGRPISSIGGGTRGYQFLALLRPNWRLGFRPESSTVGVGTDGNQGLKEATVLLKYAYCPEVITGQAENLSRGDMKAFMQAKALAAKYDMKDVLSHLNVIAVGADRNGQLASVAAAPAPGAGTFYADNASGFPGAIYLRVGMPIDTYTVGGAAAATTSNRTITAINYATRLVTHSTDTALAAEAVCLSGESCTVAQYPTTMEGLISLVSDTGALQGLDPSVSGQESWKSFVKDVSGDDLSSFYMHLLRQKVKNYSGETPDLFYFPSAQIAQLVKFATQNYRFETNSGKAIGKKALDLGFDVFEYAGLAIIEDKDARPDRIFCGASEAISKFEAVPLSLADDESGVWTRIIASTGIVDAVAGLLRSYLNIGILKRSAWGCLKGLSVDSAFLDYPVTV